MGARTTILASMLRKELGRSDSLPVDVDAILANSVIEAAEIGLDGFLGLYIPPPIGPGMLIKANQDRGQRRFTIAHELGHFALPKHAELAPSGCLSNDFYADAVHSSIEREANEFAAELLMPKASFRMAIDDRDPSFALIKKLAVLYDVSHTAAAIRLVELTSERCAVVCHEKGIVKWWYKSNACDTYLECERGFPASSDSLAAAVARGELPNDLPLDVPCGTWFGNSKHALRELESTFAIPSLDQVLSLVWALEPEDGDDESEEAG